MGGVYKRVRREELTTGEARREGQGMSRSGWDRQQRDGERLRFIA
jgi:hypothetical protein